MTDVTLRDRAERRALGILTFFAATMLATGAIQLVLVLTEKGFDDLRFVWDLMQIVWRAAIIGLAAGAAAWGRATRSPLGLVATVGIAFIALAPVLSFVGEIFELGRDLRVIFDVSRLAYGVGYAALAVGVATKVQGATRGAASVLAGIVAVAGLLAVGVGVFPKVFGGDLVEIFGQYGPLIRDALLLALLIVARSAVRDVAPGPFYASVEEQSALKEALSGTNLYRNGLTVKVFAVFAGILLGILAAGARSAGFGVIVLVLVGGATFVGELMMFIGLARYRRQPLGTGGAVDATTGFVAAVFSVIMGLAAIVGLILALSDRHIARLLMDPDVTGYATVAAFLGQIFLFTSIRRVGAWLRQPAIEAGGRSLIVLFSIVTALQLLRGMPSVMKALGGAGALVLGLGMLVLTIIALVQLFGVLRELAASLHEQIFIAPFDGPEPAVAPRGVVAAADDEPKVWDIDG